MLVHADYEIYHFFFFFNHAKLAIHPQLFLNENKMKKNKTIVSRLDFHFFKKYFNISIKK